MSLSLSPKEQALELCQGFGKLGLDCKQTNFRILELDLAKKCATVCIRQLIQWTSVEDDAVKKYFYEVKKEIEKL